MMDGASGSGSVYLCLSCSASFDCARGLNVHKTKKNTVWSNRPLTLVIGSATSLPRSLLVPTCTLVQGMKWAQRVCMNKQARVERLSTVRTRLSTLRTIRSCPLVRVTAFIMIAIGAIICLLNRVMRILWMRALPAAHWRERSSSFLGGPCSM